MDLAHLAAADQSGTQAWHGNVPRWPTSAGLPILTDVWFGPALKNYTAFALRHSCKGKIAIANHFAWFWNPSHREILLPRSGTRQPRSFRNQRQQQWLTTTA
jgi:hypothetical protein